MAEKTDLPSGERNLGNLRMIWDFAARYPGRIVAAGLSLLVAAGATLAIPSGFKRVIDNGFAAGGGDVTPYFRYLLMIVAVLAVATALRFCDTRHRSDRCRGASATGVAAAAAAPAAGASPKATGCPPAIGARFCALRLG